MTRIENFGGNVEFEPSHFYQPRSEAEVLEILGRHRKDKIRVVGRKHAWSRLIETDSVLISLEFLNQVHLKEENGQTIATIAGGCQIKRVIEELAKHALAMPSLGLISEQTIAGVISTATHGSGRHALSHYARSIRVAHFDKETGEPKISTVDSGEELRAAQCSLGLLGIILSVDIAPRPQFFVEEHMIFRRSIEDVLSSDKEYPLTQSYYLPWSDRHIIQLRKETSRPRSWLAPVYRLYWFLLIDVSLHLILVLLSRYIRISSLTRFFYRWIAPNTIIRGWKVVDRAADMLIMEHELFRHIETEIFVRRSDLPEAFSFVRASVQHFGGTERFPANEYAHAEKEYTREVVDSFFGSYTHHYVICLRRVVPDSTFLSMSSGGSEDYFAISMISYCRPNDRVEFLKFMEFLSNCLASRFRARCHWGKYVPESVSDIRQLYPDFQNFEEVRKQFDSERRFTNTFLASLLREQSISS